MSIQQPTTAPAESTPPAEQPPIMGAINKPKKKNRKKLIISLVVGSLVTIGLIAGLLWYLLVFNNPQRALEASIVNAIMSNNSVTEGRLTFEGKGNQKVTIKLKSSDAEKGQELQADITVNAGGSDKTIQFALPKVNVRNTEDATYIKLENVRSSIETAIDRYMESVSSPGGAISSRSQTKSLKETMLKQFETLINEIDGNWIKVSSDDLEQSEEAKCVMNAVRRAKDDAAVREEIAQAYRNNNFLQIKKDLGTKDGLRGFEIDLSDATLEKRKSFAKALSETTYAKKIKECGGSSSKALDTDSLDFKKVDVSLKLWIDNAKRQVRRVEFEGSSQGNKISLETGVMYGDAKKVEAPSDAKDLKDVLKKIQSSPLSSFVPKSSTPASSTSDADEA